MPRKLKTRAVARRKSPRRSRVKRVARRVGKVARRAASSGGSLAVQVARDNKHTLIAAGFGALLGAVEDRIKLWKIPLASRITPAGILAIGLFGLSFVIKKGVPGQIIRHLTTSTASIAAYILGKKYLGPSDKTVLGEYIDSLDLDMEY